MGTVILMLIMGYGISMDVENLRFAVLDRDQTVSSQAWTLNLSGSPYSASALASGVTPKRLPSAINSSRLMVCFMPPIE